MATRHFGSYTAARANLRQLLDAAHTGQITTLCRDGETFSLVEVATLRRAVSRLWPHRAVVVAEGGGWAAMVPAVPVAGEGETFDEAVTDLMSGLRDYAEDWNDHLLSASNHKDNWALVTLVELSSDEQLRDWVLGRGDGQT